MKLYRLKRLWCFLLHWKNEEFGHLARGQYGCAVCGETWPFPADDPDFGLDMDKKSKREYVERETW